MHLSGKNILGLGVVISWKASLLSMYFHSLFFDVIIVLLNANSFI